MKRLVWFVAGALAVLAVEGLAAVKLLSNINVPAREPPSRLEAFIARLARKAAMPMHAKSMANPLPKSDAALAEARAHWADHCAICHANNGSGDISMGRNMYPPAPDMRKAPTQQLTDGELFFIIENGIRFTGMPGWGTGTGSDHNGGGDSWKLVHFIRHLPELTLEETKQMEKLNPKSPDEWKEEQEEEKFLRGEGTDEPK